MLVQYQIVNFMKCLKGNAAILAEGIQHCLKMELQPLPGHHIAVNRTGFDQELVALI